MNIKFDKIGNVDGVITITIEKADYADRVNDALKDFRKKANMPGFRPGQAPIGMLKKRFGNEIAAEQVQKLLSEKLYAYIREIKINILGEPLPNTENQQSIDFNLMDKFDFVFDVALAPDFDAKLSDKDKFDYYSIAVSDEMIDQQVQMYASRAGEYKKVDAYESKDMVKGTLTELDKSGKKKRGGLVVEDAVMLPDYFKSEDEKNKFVGAQVKADVVFNPSAAYGGNETEISSLLKISKEEVVDKTSDFRFSINEITRYEPAPLNQALFDQTFGKGVVNSEEEFRSKIKESLEAQFKNDSEYKFMVDLRSYLTERIGKLEYPEETLKRIMRMNNEDKDEKFVDDNFEKSLEELTWHLIKEQLSDQFEIKITQDDVVDAAKQVTKIQFAQYGMANVPDDVLNNYANEMLKNKQQAENLVSRAVEAKITEAALKTVKLTQKEVSLEDFNKMFSEK